MSDLYDGQDAPGRDDQLATFFEVSRDLYCIRDLNGRFVRINGAWEAVLGYTIEELRGVDMLSLIHPEDVDATLATMALVDGRREAIGFVNRYRAKDGGYRQLEWRAVRAGDLVYGGARDVTERLAMEAELRHAKDVAEQATLAKTAFLANMSHEIRTPLNGVIGVIDALSRTPLDEGQLQMVELVRGSGATLERLVSDILDVSKIEAGKLELEVLPFDLEAEVGRLIEVSQVRAWEKGLDFELAVGETARGEFLGDPVRIGQVLGNLLSNAVKFTDQGGVKVLLDVQEPRAPGGEAQLVFEVADTGVGFDAGAADHLFERFTQADVTITRRFGGTGLGLSICRSLARMMGGEITASSEPGQGSRFRCSLPLPRRMPLAEYDQASGLADIPAATEWSLPAVAPGRACRILLAEDHPVNQQVIRLILQPHGPDITLVETGQAALEAFAADCFDLVLMDMQMPVMDGLTAVREIRRLEGQSPHRRRTPIAILSANAMAHHKAEASLAGADTHISKPITAASLMEGVARATRDAQRSREAGETHAQAVRPSI